MVSKQNNKSRFKSIFILFKRSPPTRGSRNSIKDPLTEPKLFEGEGLHSLDFALTIYRVIKGDLQCYKRNGTTKISIKMLHINHIFFTKSV